MAIVAVTATEKVFDGLVTVGKLLNSKQLISAIQQAKQEFIQEAVKQSGKQQSDNAVSWEGEKAFQVYQKCIAPGRQAIENYQQRTSGRESISFQLQKQFALKEPVPVEAINTSSDELVAGSPSDSLLIDEQVLKPVAKKQAAVVLPAGKAVAEKKPAEIKARLSYQMIYECWGDAPDINMHEQEQRRRVFF